MRFSSLSVLIAAAALTPLLASSDAAACGACFIQQTSVSVGGEEATVVTGHRMVVAISSRQTVLWDQIQYAGEPEDFAWVLPVKPGAVVEPGGDAFFEVLEAATQISVRTPDVECTFETVSGGPAGSPGGGSSGCSLGCASSSDAEGDGGGYDYGSSDEDVTPPPPPVEVVHEGTVGPYESVTLSTDQPGVLNDWLIEHGYNVDEASQPIIDEYVAEGFDFVALRLQPGVGVRAMTPVRVITPGGDPTIPLRTVAIGTGENVSLVLHVIGEGRWDVANFFSDQIDVSMLDFDLLAGTSNYAELRDEILAQEGGHTWITSVARNDALFGPFDAELQDFHQEYAAQAFENGETEELCIIPDLSNVDSLVAPPCTFEREEAGECEPPPLDALQPDWVGCPGADDIALAVTGMHPKDVWVTRLEANLPREALDRDLLLGASESQVGVTRTPVATTISNKQEYCESIAPPGSTVAALEAATRSRYAFGGTLAFFLFGGITRRLMRRRKPIGADAE